MARINEAYTVLGAPERRADYDRSRAGSTPRPAPSSAAPQAYPPSSTPLGARPPVADASEARFPWRLVGVMAGLGAGVVITGAALYEPPAPPVHDQVVEAGSCVFVQDTGTVVEVDCTSADSRTVRVLVSSGEECPTGTLGYRDRLGRGIVCVEPAP